MTVNNDDLHFVPVLNESGKECIATIKVKRPKDKEEEKVMLKDMDLISKTVANSMASTSKERFAEKSILKELGKSKSNQMHN